MVIKKIAGAGALALAVMLAAGCASTPTGSAADTAAYQQAVEEGLPTWVRAGGFPSKENKNGERWKGPVAEDGWFYTGSGNQGSVKLSTKSAELDGKGAIATYVKSAIVDASAGKLDTEEFQAFQKSVGAAIISGIRRVDMYIAKDGTVYALMFVPADEVDKAMKASTPEKFHALVDSILSM